MTDISELNAIIYQPIGVIHTPFKLIADTPIQGCFAPNSRGTIEIRPELQEGLRDIEGFSHLILIYHFHQSRGYELLTKLPREKEKKGIFSIRYFARPNPIGLSVVRLLKVKANILEIGEIDILDGTPLLDIKPYVPQFDIKENVKDSWSLKASERANDPIQK
jgi:tRNA-Thr(GGU) m(6)t(6)A37 methyltransferase TsaA